MVNKHSIIVLLYTLPLFLSAQSFNIEWQGCFGGSDHESAYDIIQIDNGYFIIGSTISDDGDISFNHGAGDIWLLKINNTGDLLWEKTFGGSSGEHVGKILPTNDGNYYIIGVSGSSDGDISNDPYPDSGDLWLLKIDSVGNIIWEEIFGGTGWEMNPTGIATIDGGLVALVLSSSDDGDISNHYGLWDAWMIKINSDGEKEWDFTLGTPGQDVGQAIIQTSNGGFLVGLSAILFEEGNITCTPHSIDYSEAVLVKLDANLNIEWDRCYGGSENDGATALAEVSDGYIMGGYAGSNDGDISGWHGKDDIWIVKVDFDGNILWQKCFGGSNYDDVRKLYIDEFENVIKIGTTCSNDGDVTGNHSISEYDSDIWLLKINNQGDLLWEHCFGGISNEVLMFGFHYKNENNFVIAGQTDYGPSYDVGCTPHGGNLYSDFWVFEIKDTLTSIQTKPTVGVEVKVYPNPAGDYVCFDAGGIIFDEMMGIQIFNNLGILVKDLVLYKSKGKLIWDTRNFTPGMYFYSITINNFYKTGIIIKN